MHLVCKWALFLCALLPHAVLGADSNGSTNEDTSNNKSNEDSDGYLGGYDWLLFIGLGLGGAYWFFNSGPDEELKLSYHAVPDSANNQAVLESGFIGKMKKSQRRFVVFYGTQTGTAEEFARRLAKEGARYGLMGLVADLEDCDLDDVKKIKDLESEMGGPTLACFMMATYGEGDPTDNAIDFNEWLNGDNIELPGLNFAVFGLGNKTYEHYNKMGIFTDKRLETFGGKRVCKLGLGDDDSSLEEDFLTWKEEFWLSVCESFKIDSSVLADFNSRAFEEKILQPGEYDENRLFRGEPKRLHSLENQNPPYDMRNPFMAPITVNRPLHSPESDRYAFHIDVNIADSKLRYEAGDHIGVHTKNNDELVDKLGQLLSVDLDVVITLNSLDPDSDKKHPFPCPVTRRTALLHYIDITSYPRTHVLKELVQYTEDEEEKAHLDLMTQNTPEGRKLYQEWVVKACRHIVHILEDLKSCKPPLDHILELLPRLQPRFYSISSSALVSPNSVSITGVVVQYETPTKRINKGVATTWLKEMIPGNDVKQKIPVFIRRSQFRLPTKTQVPIIMIGPGTGYAPFRGFLQERIFHIRNNKEVGENLLFFGCRNKNLDFIYKNELEEWEEKKYVTLVTAFSRDQTEKVYVSHRLKENAETIWDLIGNKSGHLYVCGDAKLMAKDVHNIIINIVSAHGKMSRPQAEKYIKQMEDDKRYSSDVW